MWIDHLGYVIFLVSDIVSRWKSPQKGDFFNLKNNDIRQLIKDYVNTASVNTTGDRVQF